MLILISSAKTMASVRKQAPLEVSRPQFQNEVMEIAQQMAHYSYEELSYILKVNRKIAMENYMRYRDILSGTAPSMPAALAYTGVVYKNLDPTGLTTDEWLYMQHHLRIGSGMYGLLRPADEIAPYRMEYDVKLPDNGGITTGSFWRDRLTSPLIEDCRQTGSVLVSLCASDLLTSLHWKKVTEEIRVVTPDFKVWKEGKLKSIVVYLKMARGKLTRHIIRNRITDPEELKYFTWEGFSYHEELSTGNNWIYLQE